MTITAGRVSRTIFTSFPVASSRSARQKTSARSFEGVPIMPESR